MPKIFSRGPLGGFEPDAHWIEMGQEAPKVYFWGPEGPAARPLVAEGAAFVRPKKAGSPQRRLSGLRSPGFHLPVHF